MLAFAGSNKHNNLPPPKSTTTFKAPIHPFSSILQHIKKLVTQQISDYFEGLYVGKYVFFFLCTVRPNDSEE